MPAKRELSMRQLRHLLRLHHDGVSAREIGRRLGVARSTIQDNLKRAEAAGLAWPLADGVTDEAQGPEMGPTRRPMRSLPRSAAAIHHENSFPACTADIEARGAVLPMSFPRGGEASEKRSGPSASNRARSPYRPGLHRIHSRAPSARQLFHVASEPRHGVATLPAVSIFERERLSAREDVFPLRVARKGVSPHGLA
jgi:hypothetical protein